MYQLSKISESRLDGINSTLKAIVKQAIKTSPIDFGIPADGGLRTAERQNELFKKGVSKCDGYKKKSYHQTGKAFDIYAYVDGKASWNAIHLKIIARHIQEVAKTMFNVDLEWGGDWKSFRDMPHFQIK